MKNQIYYWVLPTSFIVILLLMISVNSAIVAQQSMQPRDVIPGYVGWAGNPDTLTVHIDSTFTEAEKDSVRVGIQRWNAAGCVPALKEVSSPPANVTVTEGNPGDGNAGVYAWETDADGKVTGGTITIRNNPNPGLVETATHELGHALGLDDVDQAANPGDVMKGSGPPNGTNGNLSQHDSTELRAAVASITALSDLSDKKKVANFPNKASLPGQNSLIVFQLDEVYPPTTEANVMSLEDPLLTVNNFFLNGDQLVVDVFLHPMHGSGKYYLDVQIFPPFPQPPVSFIGFHYVHQNPADPVPFNAPCNIFQTPDGKVHVYWQGLHDYPFPNPLRAMLTVNGEAHYLTRGNFAIDLPPGNHTFMLQVHDYQVNSSVFVTTFEVGSPTDFFNPGSEPFIVYDILKFGVDGDYPELPPDFFNPGSEPFIGEIKLKGANSNGLQEPSHDVLIERLSEVEFTYPYPSTATIPIEIVELQLVSTQPIQVTYGGSWTVDSFFDVYYSLSSPVPGTAEITKENLHGGSYTMEFSLHPLILFVNTVNPDHVVVFDPAFHGYPMLDFSSIAPHPWSHSPMPGTFDPSSEGFHVMQTLAGSNLYLNSLLARDDDFVMEMNELGEVVESEGSGYNNGEWYYYPNTDWWNVWFFDHPVDDTRYKVINGSINIQTRDMNLPAYAEIVLNWSTPAWQGWPAIQRPPLPGDVADPTLEDLYIVRSAPIFVGSISNDMTFAIEDFIIEGYNPEWISIDIRGANFILNGSLQHSCFKKQNSPVPSQPSDYELRVGDWLVAEPWHQWIDGSFGSVTPVQLHVHDPDDQIELVEFEHNIDNDGWVMFDSDDDGEECTASPYFDCDEMADGWSGEFVAPVLTSSVMAEFRAKVTLDNGEVVFVDSFFDVMLDINPPSAVSVNVEDHQVLEEDEFELQINSNGTVIDSVVVIVEKKQEEFQKGIDTLSQRRSWRTGYKEGGDNHCVPTAAAACLKYFADSAGDDSIMDGLTPDQLVDLLAALARTNVGIWGTYYSKIASALRAWIAYTGGNYTVRGPMGYDWKTMRNELERSQDVLQGIRWPDGGGHMMTFNSIVNRPLENGKMKIDFMDPWTGELEYGELDTVTGQVTDFTGAGPEGRLDWTIIVCPKETKRLPDGGQKKAGPNPPSIQLNFPNQGLHWLRIEILDTDGNKSRKDIIVDRVFTQQQIAGTVPAGQEDCHDGTDIITTGGDTPYVVEDGGSVTLAAKKRVEVTDYTHFKQGSYAHLFIADEACLLELENSLIREENELAGEFMLDDLANDLFFNVFPNPTPGLFTLEVKDIDEPTKIVAEIYNLLGERILKQELPAMEQYHFDISEHQPGIYLIRVMMGDEVGVEKIIKQ
ncbi:MAG: T9SS type A sorting domain-containing protein [Bacteroidales bacterium]|nr:T9SS type A sorting domain-containing protein [Bacteroidales bacterium]